MRSPEKHDLVIVGGGPAGLSAAINAESEGVDTLILDGSPRLGGQAGTSSFIENYPGFPEGISGPDLMFKMVDQAGRFDTEFFGPVRATGLEHTEEGVLVESENSRSFIGLTALLATGVQHRHLEARNLAVWLGRGVEYGSPNLNDDFKDQTIYVVGGANSAGQAAQHLRSFTDCKVHLIIRGDSIEAKMSDYLVRPLKEAENVVIHTNTVVKGVDGTSQLEELTLEHDGLEEVVPADRLFVMIGSAPNTKWLPAEVACDEKGFIMSGRNIPVVFLDRFRDQNGGRAPYGHETSLPGVFAVGDTRHGTIKRVASAVGDAGSAISEIHEYFAGLKEAS